jgi:ABC-type uncharacterized transport system involved in gliding motility auxiliary subunit
MRASRATRLRLRLTSAGFVVLLLAVAGLTLWLARDYHLQVDWSAAGRNSLSEASKVLLQRLDKPVTITAFATERADLRKGIREFIARYQRHKPDVTLSFVNPDTDPTRVREAGVRVDGELVVGYGGREDHLERLTEEALTQLLARLARGGERWIIFLSGHGERSVERQANHDLSTFAAQLKRRGLTARTIALGEGIDIPRNTAVLVIPGPAKRLLPGEVRRIEDYLDRGGNLLWLADPGPLNGLEPVAERLGIEFRPGMVVDANSQAITGSSPAFYVATRYPPHPALKGFDLATLFPESAALSVQAPKGWQAQPLIETGPEAWVESTWPAKSVRFDAGADVRGPLTLGVTLTREHEGRAQRVTIMGDGDFLSNTFLGNGGNLELGLNVLNWTTSDESQVNVPVRTAPDTRLDLSPRAQSALAALFLIGLPLVLVGTGIAIWWRRRRT